MSRLLNKPDCEACKLIHKKGGNDPPCDTCVPPLMSSNQEIVKAYFMCRNQVILAPMGGPIDIDINAVDTVCKRLGFSDTVFENTVTLARYFIREQQKDNA